ncbi:AraC family transcriptional regulator [Roseateles sp. PN1]|uniref:AraC family transcriptional regulator n=1 Tax=Roseateles sp. PN1 TaxID=3137372 RepID=UPI0031386C36
MPKHIQTIQLQSLYIRQIAEHVAAVGGDVAQWLARGGLRPAQLELDLPELPMDAFARLVEGAIAITKEPALGLLVGDRLRINTLGVLGFAAMSGGSLRQVIELLVRYIGLRTSLVSLAVQVHRHELRLVVLEPIALGSARRSVLEAVLLALKHALEFNRVGHGMSSGLSSGPVSRVAFAMPAPAYADFARQLVGCELAWSSSWSGLVLPIARADEALSAADASAYAQAEQLCERERLRLASQQSTTARVQRLLLESSAGLPGLPLVARQLHLGQRTLHRRLLEEGTSFRQITEDLRRSLASEHLQRGQLTVQEVAYLLGYTDLANFRRAFRRWQGMSPSDYRAACADVSKTRD